MCVYIIFDDRFNIPAHGWKHYFIHVWRCLLTVFSVVCHFSLLKRICCSLSPRKYSKWSAFKFKCSELFSSLNVVMWMFQGGFFCLCHSWFFFFSCEGLKTCESYFHLVSLSIVPLPGLTKSSIQQSWPSTQQASCLNRSCFVISI